MQMQRIHQSVISQFVIFMLMMLVMQGWAAINGDGQESLTRTLSAKTHGKSKLIIGAGVSYAQDREYVADMTNNLNNGTGLTFDTSRLESAKMLSSNLFLSIGTTSWLDFAAMLPVYYDWAGFGDIRDGGLGDVELSMKVLYPPQREPRFYYQAYYMGVTVPVGMRNRGLFPRHAFYLSGSEDKINPATTFYSSDLPGIKPMLLWTFDFGALKRKVPLELLVNFGGVLMTDFSRNNMLVAGVALNYSPTEVVDIFVDASGESRLANFSSGFKLANDPIMVSPGVRLNTTGGVSLVIAADICISPFFDETRYSWTRDNYQYSTAVGPRWGVQFQICWKGFLAMQDDDRDGLKNDEDRCPRDAEDIDGFEDVDGCPESDNDNDGVADIKDKCPLDPEDKDGFLDDDGCPDSDNDNDGILDLQDHCPRLAEDFDGFHDHDGCSDEDNDNDGISDSLDKCPNDPEDVDKFEDDDGCPDIDNDNDGITDFKDKCPGEPETMNGIEDQDGCPDEKVNEPKMPKNQILKGVNFKTNGVEMTFDSYQYLDPIVAIMKEYTIIEIEIRGHTDGLGKYEDNLRISQMRAEAVRQYLLSKGIDAVRVRAVGFGSSSPIADNRTADGRMQNRRIEVVRIK